MAKKAKKKAATKKAPAKAKKKVTKKVTKTKTKAAAKPAKATQAAKMPVVGDPAPDFEMTTHDGDRVSLKTLRGKNVVLYFYPKDDTPGCTKEACSFQNALPQFNQKNTVILGVSADSSKSHVKFREKYGLEFPLATDDDNSVAKRYGVWVLKNMYGRKYMGVQRATFLIGKDSKLAASWPKVQVEGHSAEVMAALAGL
jgi:peroxiredoxin Q/BCP